MICLNYYKKTQSKFSKLKKNGLHYQILYTYFAYKTTYTLLFDAMTICCVSRVDSDWRVSKYNASVPNLSKVSCQQNYNAVGFILYTNSSDGIKYALVKRRVSYGLHKVLMAKSNDSDFYAEISDNERVLLLDICNKVGDYEETFKRLWRDAWWGKDAVCERFIQQSFSRFMNKRFDIKERLTKITSIFPNGVWGFPKGRNDKQQNEILCALREVREETGIRSAWLSIQPFEPLFENYKRWTYKYFVAKVDDKYAISSLIKSNYTIDTEVSEVVWLTYEDAVQLIPCDMLEKKYILTTLHNKLMQNSI